MQRSTYRFFYFSRTYPPVSCRIRQLMRWHRRSWVLDSPPGLECLRERYEGTDAGYEHQARTGHCAAHLSVVQLPCGGGRITVRSDPHGAVAEQRIANCNGSLSGSERIENGNKNLRSKKYRACKQIQPRGHVPYALAVCTMKDTVKSIHVQRYKSTISCYKVLSLSSMQR